MASLQDAFEKARSRDVDLYVQEVSLMRQLIRERKHPLDLLRELVSNAAAREVKAGNIWIRCYPHPQDVYVFEVEDDGVGMDYSENPMAGYYGRLNRFLSLGLSAVVGAKSDEFAWKGLGSKLAFHSRRLVVETYTGEGPERKVEVNAPWETITAGRKPRPKIYESDPSSDRRPGTKVTVFGHPPDVKKEYPFSYIRDYLVHRTFIGFTRHRDNPPKVELSVGNSKETLDIGFPVLKRIEGERGPATRFVNLSESTHVAGTNSPVTVTLRGLYSTEAARFGLSEESGNTGLILSVLGIPYFDLGLENYTEGRRGLGMNPSAKNCCLIVECDQIQEEMNISRSGINDGAMKEAFDRAVKMLLRRVAESEEYSSFVA
ncbi:MAG: sensor histidine kinase, partial [Deltaproteobacteria bacterium]|nr:sensor histidine kinase [Deltaproteobacteria bacterium]